MTAPFRFADSERMFGATGAAELDRFADKAPPMGAEAAQRLSALFASVRRRVAEAPAADAA
jgi:hypothetical protein